LFASVLAVPLAAAQEARKVEIAYEITFGGIAGFRVEHPAGPTDNIERKLDLSWSGDER